MAQVMAGLSWLRSHLIQSLVAVAVAGTLVHYQFAQSDAQARLKAAQQRLQVVQVQAARVEAREKKTASAQQLVDSIQGNLLTGDIFYGRLNAIQRAERESGARVTAFKPGAPLAINAAPAIQLPTNAKPAASSDVDQALAAASSAPKPAAGPAPVAANASGYRRYPVEVVVEGTYNQVLAFARYLERGSPLARINNLELSAIDAKSSSLSATIYFYGP